MATATLPTTVPPEMARLRAEMDKRGSNRLRIARKISYLKHSPDRIYKILNGTRPAPADFIEIVCGLTGIPLSAVLEPEDSQALSEYLSDVAFEENLQRMGEGW